MVEARGVSKRYEGKRTVHALRGVSFAVAKGEMVALMGPSGSGKSTLLNILGGLDRSSEGSVWIDGSDLSRLTDDELTRLRRLKIGFVFQFFNLLPTLTARENIALPLHLAGVSRRATAARAGELLELIGLAGRADHLPDELSGGEQQRIAMARALALEPPVILADEPTGNLDTKTGQEILALFHDLRRKLGATVIMVTHDAQASSACDRIIRLRDGLIVDDP